MAYRLAADAVLVAHFAFIVFMVGGGFLAWRWRSVVWFHLPVVVWGTAISLLRFRCPLTPLENHLRQLAGGSGYDGGFIDHYVAGVVYPSGLTPTIQTGLAASLVIVTTVAYAGLLRRRGVGTPARGTMDSVGASQGDCMRSTA
ncbi:MAG: DUF2784 domain-containing protein [Acidimicrobiales bacterium]